MIKKPLVEFVGAFFLVFTVGMTVVLPGAGDFAPLAIGGVLMVMVYAGGSVSGGHYNPAVTLGVCLRGRATAADFFRYAGAQVLAGVVAAALVLAIKPDLSQWGIAAPTIHLMPALLCEFLFTFALVWVVLSTATAKATEGNSYYGLAIGSTVMVGAFSVGEISGAVFNPAVGVGASIMGLLPWTVLPGYVGVELAGGALAACLFRFIHADDH